MKVYSFIISLLTKDSAENTAALANTKDLRPHVLAHLGRAVMNSLVGETYKVEAVPSLRAGYQALVDLGKEAIISLIDYLGAGKMRLDELTNPDWNTILNRETLVHFRDFFTPSVASIQPRAT